MALSLQKATAEGGCATRVFTPIETVSAADNKNPTADLRGRARIEPGGLRKAKYLAIHEKTIEKQPCRKDILMRGGAYLANARKLAEIKSLRTDERHQQIQ